MGNAVDIFEALIDAGANRTARDKVSYLPVTFSLNGAMQNGRSVAQLAELLHYEHLAARVR